MPSALAQESSHVRPVRRQGKLYLMREKPKPKPEPVLTAGETAMQYAIDVVDGTEPASNRVHQQAMRWIAQIQDGVAEYRPEVVDELADWVYRRFKIVKGPYEGEQYTYEPCQLWLLAMMKATFKPGTDNVLYKKIFIVSGKSGYAKTTFAAIDCIINLFHPDYRKNRCAIMLVAIDGVAVRETIFGEAVFLVQQARADGFLDEAEIVQSKESFIKNKRTSSKIMPGTRESYKNLAGITMTGFVHEEYGKQDSRRSADTFDYADKGYSDTQQIYLSNGGYGPDTPAHQDYREYCAVLDGVQEQDSWCPVIAQFDKYATAKDWTNPIEHKKACPMLGVATHPEYYEEKAAELRANTNKIATFLRDMGGLFVEGTTGWLDTDIWNSKCVDGGAVLRELTPEERAGGKLRNLFEDFHGKHLFVSIDLARTKDLCSYWFLAQTGEVDKGPVYTGFCRNFAARGKDGLQARFDKEKILDYPWMEQKGFLNVTETLAVDYREMAVKMLEDIAACQGVEPEDVDPSLVTIAFDNHFKEDFDERADGLGLSNIEQLDHPQKAYVPMKDGAKDTERLNMPDSILAAESVFNDGRLVTTYNPIMTHALHGAIIDEGETGAIKKFKRNDKAKYDAAVCFAMVCGLAKRFSKRKPQGFKPSFASMDSMEMARELGLVSGDKHGT